MQPLTKLADLKARHRGEASWIELVILDNNTRAEVISSPPGSKVARHMHPDSPEWWVVEEGRIRFEIESPPGQFQVVEARKGSYVFAPERHVHSLEAIGAEPAIRLQVTLAETTSVFETPPTAAVSGVEYVAVHLDTGVNPLDVPVIGSRPDRIHVNIEDLEAAHKGQSQWSEPAMRKNRVRGNFIYGHARDNPAARPGDRGHFHADFAEFWIVLRGRLRWFLEGIPQPVEAVEGDIVYAPPKTFHRIEFAGEGPACRLTSSTFPSANHIYDAGRTGR